MSSKATITTNYPADGWVRHWAEGDACFALWQGNLWCQAVVFSKRHAEGVPSLYQELIREAETKMGDDSTPESISSSVRSRHSSMETKGEDTRGQTMSTNTIGGIENVKVFTDESNCIGVIKPAPTILTGPSKQAIMKKLATARKWEYYLHFSDFNRRLDRWVHVDDIRDSVSPHTDAILGINVVATPQGYKPMWGGGLATSSSAAQAAISDKGTTDRSQEGRSAESFTSGMWAPGTLITAAVSPLVPGNPQVPNQGSWSPSSSAAAPAGVSGTYSEGYGTLSTSSSRGLPAARISRAVLRREKTRGIISEGAPPVDAADIALEKEHEERTKVKNIDIIQLGKYEVDAWYYSPYPDEYKQCHRLFVCEFCLKYMRSARVYLDHTSKCSPRHPPGVEIYRKDNVSVWELDGGQQRLYCQCLCLLAKLFIDHKTLYYDVEPFLFYVMTENDDEGSHIVGYFSKEKSSTENYNVACILTFPQHQRKGFGRFLIDFSYALTKIEGGVGSPEKPLSDLGKLSYRAYWTQTLIKTMASTLPKEWTVPRLSQLTAITQEDVAGALHSLNLLQYARGQHYVDASPRLVEQLLTTHCKGKQLELDQNLIQWEPYPQAPSRKRVRRSKGDLTSGVGVGGSSSTTMGVPNSKGR